MKPADFRPQLAKLPTKTSIRPPEAMASDEWDVERKWDGMRAVFHILPCKGCRDPEVEYTENCSGGKTLIFTRNGLDLRAQFPEFHNLHEHFSAPCVLDGEIVAMKDGDTEDLELLQMRAGDVQAKRRDEIPVEVRFFDVIQTDLETPKFLGEDHSHQERMEMLGVLLAPTPFETPTLLHEGEIPAHWEGVVVKRRSSLYRPGKRNSDWLKFKATHRATLRAIGLTPGLGNRADHFGAVLVEDANGVFRGQVGSGFSDAQIEEIESWGPWWDEAPHSEWPLIEIEYRFLSKTGLMVNTSFKGARPDKDEADVL